MRLLLSSVLILLNTTLLHAENKTFKVAASTLGKIDVEESGETSAVTIRLSSKPKWSEYQIKDHGTFIQVNLPQTIVPNPGEFINGAGPIVQKIAAFQSPDNTAGVRLFLSEDAALVKKSLKHDLLGERILITIDHKKLAELVSKDPANTAITSIVNTAQSVIDKTEVSATIAAPANKIKFQKEESASSIVAFKKTPELSKQLTKVSIFSGVLLFGLLGFHLIRSRFKLRRKKSTNTNIKEEELKLISSHVLAPKQKIQLLEICGQKILLSVSPEGISYLTSIQEPAKPEVIRHRLPEQPQITPNIIASNSQIPKKLPEAKPRPTNRSTTPRTQRTQAVKRYGESQVPIANNRPSLQSSDAINDVTKLIREKLKNLPAI